MVVDDDELFLEAFRRYANKFRVAFIGVSSCAEARDSMGHRWPDAIVLDANLTNGTGVELYRDIFAKAPNEPVVFLTGYDSNELQAKVEAIGPARVHCKDRFTDPTFIFSLFEQIGLAPTGA